jgi:hypothetical protein
LWIKTELNLFYSSLNQILDTFHLGHPAHSEVIYAVLCIRL